MTSRSNVPAGLIVNYQDPENYGIVVLAQAASSGLIYYQEFEDGKGLATRASGSFFTATDNTAYTLKAVGTESGGNQTLDARLLGEGSELARRE